MRILPLPSFDIVYSNSYNEYIFALILDILHIHAHEYSSYSFEQKLLSLTRAVSRSGEKEHAGCADIRARK
jgi:hypothetical protein